MLQNTQAFILKINPKGETSSVVHCYSADFGKLVLIAKGARSPKSSFKGLLEPFSLLNIHFNEKKGRPYQFLAQAENIRPFTHLKERAEGILYGSILLEILYKMQEQQADVRLFETIRTAFDAMDRGYSAIAAHWFFILRYMQLEGLPLDTENCYACGQALERAFFLPHQGHIYCPSCSSGRSFAWELKDEVLSILKRLNISDPSANENLNYGKEQGILISRVLWNALATRFENCKTLQSVSILRKVL
jgi:DNA repair protein RecO (recombination protein O)